MQCRGALATCVGVRHSLCKHDVASGTSAMPHVSWRAHGTHVKALLDAEVAQADFRVLAVRVGEDVARHVERVEDLARAPVRVQQLAVRQLVVHVRVPVVVVDLVALDLQGRAREDSIRTLDAVWCQLIASHPCVASHPSGCCGDRA